MYTKSQEFLFHLHLMNSKSFDRVLVRLYTDSMSRKMSLARTLRRLGVLMSFDPECKQTRYESQLWGLTGLNSINV